MKDPDADVVTAGRVRGGNAWVYYQVVQRGAEVGGRRDMDQRH